MAFLQKRYSRDKRWICKCKRINDPEDQRCAFCREPKPDGRKKGEKSDAKESKQARLNVAKRTEYNGLWYQSKLEANYAMQLDFRIRAGEVKKWKRQVKIELKVNGVKICNYYIDFKVTMADGSTQYVEVKGLEMELWKMKWKLCMALKEEIDPGAEWIVVK